MFKRGLKLGLRTDGAMLFNTIDYNILLGTIDRVVRILICLCKFYIKEVKFLD